MDAPNEWREVFHPEKGSCRKQPDFVHSEGVAGPPVDPYTRYAPKGAFVTILQVTYFQIISVGEPPGNRTPNLLIRVDSTPI